MKKKIKELIMIMIVVLSPLYVEAHPGRTDSNGCHTCRTNCAKWGLRYGQYHCHGRKNKSTSSNTNKTTTTKVLDSNKNIKSISIDNTNIEVKDTMEYITYNMVNSIDIILESTKSKYEISNYSNLSIGDNNIKITVTSEDNTSKEYNLNIKYLEEPNISSISINNDNIDINDYMEYHTTLDNVNINTFSNSKVEYDSDIKLKDGINNVELKLLDSNDNVYKTYTLSIVKDSVSSSNDDKKENASNNDGAITTIFLILISIVIYRKFKKKKHVKSQ
ncbi:MAG TPA: hypothetical protein DHU33_02095 [Firmicutes bacterium]|nr:hypothetical protein [Bacillota bacterium]